MFVPNGASYREKLVDSVEELNDINLFLNHLYRMQIRYIEYEQIYNPATRRHLKTLEKKLRISCNIFENVPSTGNFNDRTLPDIQKMVAKISRSRGLRFQNHILNGDYYWFRVYCRRLSREQ